MTQKPISQEELSEIGYVDLDTGIIDVVLGQHGNDEYEDAITLATALLQHAAREGAMSKEKQDAGEPVAWISDHALRYLRRGEIAAVAPRREEGESGEYAYIEPLYRHPSDAIPREKVEALVVAAWMESRTGKTGWLKSKARAALREHTQDN